MNQSTTLKNILDSVRPQLDTISESKAHEPLAPRKWSPIQTIGHLCDSAINNIGRVIRAQKTDHLIFEGYEQEFWVEANDYQNGDWPSVRALFLQLNFRMAEIAKNIPEEILNLPRHKHNLTPPSYAQWDPKEAPTLDFWIEDYIGHLENHLKQVLPDYEPVVLSK